MEIKRTYIFLKEGNPPTWVAHPCTSNVGLSFPPSHTPVLMTYTNPHKKRFVWGATCSKKTNVVSFPQSTKYVVCPHRNTHSVIGGWVRPHRYFPNFLLFSGTGQIVFALLSFTGIMLLEKGIWYEKSKFKTVKFSPSYFDFRIWIQFSWER